jgi:hypothetical protein
MMECELPEEPWNQMEPPTRSTFPWNENEFAEQLAEAREIFEKKDPFCSCGEDYIHNIMVEEDGNFTIVVLDTDFGPIVGVSKFNPVDVKVIRREDKYGDITYDEKSAFNPETGFRKAVVRAINKLIEKL